MFYFSGESDPQVFYGGAHSKALCSVATVSGLREMLRAWDLVQFTIRPEAAVKSFNSLQRFLRDWELSNWQSYKQQHAVGEQATFMNL